MSVRSWVLVLGLVLVVGCDGARSRPTGGTRPGQDAGVAADSGALDAGAGEDAGALSDAGSEVDAGPGADAGPGQDAGPAQDAGVGDAGADAGLPEVPYCRQTCGSPADCVTQGSPLTDVDNYACTGGECVYLGCLSDAECQGAFQSADWVCRAFVAGAPSCTRRCTAVADCVVASTLLDADNYACTQGGCHWLGCKSTQECVDAYQSSDWVCAPSTVEGIDANCVRTCFEPTDCVQAGASPAYDADNYACLGGQCVYSGCNSAAECGADAVCR